MMDVPAAGGGWEGTAISGRRVGHPAVEKEALKGALANVLLTGLG